MYVGKKEALELARRARAAIAAGATDEQLAGLFNGDYIPGGESVRTRDLYDPQPAAPLDRCGTPVGNDVQSGPFYCGEPATIRYLVENRPGMVVCVCDKHNRSIEGIVRRKAANALAASGESAAL